MTLPSLSPQLTPASELTSSLKLKGFAVISAEDVAQIARVPLQQLLELSQFWENLPRDPYLKDGGGIAFEDTLVMRLLVSLSSSFPIERIGNQLTTTLFMVVLSDGLNPLKLDLPATLLGSHFYLGLHIF